MFRDQDHEVVGMGLNGPDLHIDFRDTVSERLIADVFHSVGPFDVLINNAGTTEIDFIQDHETCRFSDVLQANLVWPFALSRRFVIANYGRRASVPYYRIINTTSMGVKMSMRGSPGYCAAKAGLEALTRQMAKELADKPFMVAAVGPGTVENTKMSESVISAVQRTRNMTEDEARKYCMQSPMGRACTHEEVWKVFDFLVNDAPQYISGSTIYLPGGMGI